MRIFSSARRRCESRFPAFAICLLTSTGFLVPEKLCGQQPSIQFRHSIPPVDAIRNSIESESHSRAIGGAWDRLVVSVLYEGLNHEEGVDRDLWLEGHAISAETAWRFLGFIEGRLGVSTPHYWQRCVESATYVGTGPISFPTTFIAPWYSLSGSSLASPEGLKLDLGAPGSNVAQFTTDNGRVVVSLKTAAKTPKEIDKLVGKEARLPPALSKLILASPEPPTFMISDVLFASRSLYLAEIDSESSTTSRIHRLSIDDKGAAEIDWSTKLPQYGPAVFKGDGNWFTQIAIDDASIIAFSCSQWGISIDRIDKASGEHEPLFNYTAGERQDR